MSDFTLFENYRKTKDISLRNEIIEKYMYLADSIVRKYLNKGVEYDDLFQVACYGLVLAAERFDESMGVKFSTYATPTIMGEIKKYFRDKGCIIKLPRKLYDIFQRANRIRLKRMEYEGYVPTIDEIASVLKVEKKQIVDAMSYESIVNVLSIDVSIYDESPALEKVIGYEEDGFLIVDNEDFLKYALKNLTLEEKRFIIQRYYRNRSQRDIAKKMGVSQMYVSRLERKVLEKLKLLYFKN
ncbi:MAG: sigma-70 family RNA polymerase sigma factor [Ruminococcaceae bacterium]|nr:sigma-70 family RNA polymerase sigma factor [Oscillospiraceae bacterium]